MWQAGKNSLVDDVRFLGGHGSGTNPYNNNHTADSDWNKRWDGQYPSLWVTRRGWGHLRRHLDSEHFCPGWVLRLNTKTPGHVYELSTEHHVRNEIKFDHVENWDINAPQTEEEAGESPESLSLEFDWSNNITVANYHGYRVTRSRAPFRRQFDFITPVTFISAMCMSTQRAGMQPATRMAAAHFFASASSLTKMRLRI
jgi:hypothetical protein